MVELSNILSARGDALIKITKKIKEIFTSDIQKIVYSCFMIVTKVSQDYSEQDILGNINEICEDNSSLGVEEKMILTTLLNYKRIFCWPTPDIITRSLTKQLEKAILDVPCYNISIEPKISLSHEARLCL